MIIILTTWIEGKLGFHKSVVELANGLHRAGRDVAVIRMLGHEDGHDRMIPRWPLDVDIPVYPLQTLAARGGRLLHRNVYPALTVWKPSRMSLTANQLAVLRELNGALTADDVVIFTHSMVASTFQQALQGDKRNPRTVLQIHEDYQWSRLPWEILMESRGVVDQIQTVSTGLRDQFSELWGEENVTFVPNFPGAISSIGRVQHEGVNLVLPALFESRKNQQDAVRAMAHLRNRDVRLALWGNNSTEYGASTRALISRLGLDSVVSVPGYGNDEQVYSEADIIVMTSRMEGLPYTLVEAAARGVPAITYDFKYGPRDVIEDGESGFIVPMGDVKALAQKIDILASDADLRYRFSARTREIFDERFSERAVARSHEAFLGPERGAFLDLGELFGTDRFEPVDARDISYSSRSAGGSVVHRLVLKNSTVHDVRIDNGGEVREAEVRHSEGATHIMFVSSNHEVVSYATEPGGEDRHYLANITSDRRIEVRPYLRRDAATFTTASTDDRIVTITGAGTILRMTTADAFGALRDAAGGVSEAVRWKVGQIRGVGIGKLPAPEQGLAYGFRTRVRDPWGEFGEVDPVKEVIPGIPAGPSTPAESGVANAPTPRSAAPVAPAQSSVEGRAENVRQTTLGGQAARKLVRRFARDLGARLSHPTETGRRVIRRHPWYPVTSGIDNFGVGVGADGGVTVRNTGTILEPTVTVQGEYDWVDLRFGPLKRRIEAPLTYREMYDRLCEAESEHGLFDIEDQGVHVWELGRSALVADLANAFGFWSAVAERGDRPVDIYDGPKRLADAPSGRKFLMGDFRRGGSDHLSAAFQDGSAIEVVFPTVDGYPEVGGDNLQFPFHEYTSWQRSTARRMRKARVKDIDSRPFEEVLSRAFGLGIDLSDHLRYRMLKFRDEREFFSRVFEKIRPQELLLISGHWWAGISQAARDLGIPSSDIQYANTGRYHPTYWFGGRPHHGAQRFYAWSEFWRERTNAYEESRIVPRVHPLLKNAIDLAPTVDPRWDVVMLGQPTISRRVTAALREMATARPTAKIAYAPHPFELYETVRRRFALAGVPPTVEIATEGTFDAALHSKVCVGGYSTTMWEIAAMGRPVYVLPVPGAEIAADDIPTGLFRAYTGPDDLDGFEVSEVRKEIFQFADRPER